MKRSYFVLLVPIFAFLHFWKLHYSTGCIFCKYQNTDAKILIYTILNYQIHKNNLLVFVLIFF